MRSRRRASLLALILATLLACYDTRAVPRRSTIQSAGESFFLSNFYFSSEALSAAVVKDAFSSKNCSVDAACGPQQLLPLAQAAVTLTHPLIGNFCSGSLIRGAKEGSTTTYVLTAWHCTALGGLDISFPYPWSTYGILINYRLPCNATVVDENAFQNLGVIQGLRLVWADREADTALFELLSDIPPAWEAALQGWDARGVDRPREEDYVSFYNYNFPSGDAQKFTSGIMLWMYRSQTFFPNASLVLDVTECTDGECGFMATLNQEGSTEPGSSGSGYIEASSQRLVGVLSGNIYSGSNCGIPDLDKLIDAFNNEEAGWDVFGRLEKAWELGLWEHLGGESPDQKLARDWEAFSVPSPGLAIINPAPLFIEGGLQQAFAIMLTEPPPSGTTTVTLSLPDTQLVDLLPDSLTFTTLDWSIPQYVTIIQGQDTLPEGAPATSFAIEMEWPIVTADGEESTRTRALRGVYKKDIKASDFSNPYLLDALKIGEWTARSINMAVLTTEDEFITTQEGPFVPTAFLAYTTPSGYAQGLKIEACPSDGATFSPETVVMDSTYRFYSLLPQERFEDNGCHHTWALLDSESTYYFLAFPSFDFTVPGAAGTVRGGITFNISAIEPLDMVNNMVATEDIYFVDQIPSEYTVTPKSNGDPTLLLITPDDTYLLDISTCNPGTTTHTVLALFDAATLEPIRADSGVTGLNTLNQRCGSLLGVVVEKSKSYLVVVGQDLSRAKLSREARQIDLSIQMSDSSGSASEHSGALNS